MSRLAEPLLGVRVLLVDDDEDARELFELALTQAGAEVRVAADAKEAIRTVLAWTPSLLVSDLSLPEMDGGTLLREMRSIGHLRELPAVAVSGFAGSEDRAGALSAGFQEHAGKPLDPGRLVSLVERWAARGESGS